MKNIPLLICIALAITITGAGCNLARETPPAPPPNGAGTLSAATVALTGVVTASPTPQPSATLTPTPTRATTQGGNTSVSLPPCTPRTDWPTYTVAAGDTLFNIAARANSSVSELTAANCLDDRNLIRAGQVLRVPRTPATLTPTPGTEGETGTLQISPVVAVNGSRYQLSPGSTVTITWLGAPGSLPLVEFSMAPVANLNQIIALGTDQTPGNGATITWTVPAEGVSAQLYAGGRYPGQEHRIAYAPFIEIYTASSPTAQPTAEATATNATVGHIFSDGLLNQFLVMPLVADSEVLLTWVCAAEDSDEAEFVITTDTGERISLGRTTRYEFYTKCFRDNAYLNAVVPDRALKGQLYAVGYLNGQVTARSAPVSVEISREE